MTAVITKSIDDPIVTISLTGQFDEETLAQITTEGRQLLEELGTYYALVVMDDLPNNENQAAIISRLVKETALGDERVKVIGVSQATTLSTTQIPIFKEHGQAADHIRQLIAQNAPGQSEDRNA